MSSSIHKSYPDLVDLLQQRGMLIMDKDRAIRKLSQIGYYRLSGYWYPCRKGKTDETGNYVHDQKTGVPIRKDEFQDGVSFDSIIDLYLFDKRLRQMMLDALERIEIHIRTVIAHEIGYYDELAYQKSSFLNPKQLKEKCTPEGKTTSNWAEWESRQKYLIAKSKEECILHHKNNDRDIPFWVVVETWNRVSSVHIRTLNDDFFQVLHLSQDAKNRIYGKICILWFLVQKIGPGSKWLEQVADLVDSKPNVECLPFTAMGFPDNSGFPRDKFKL